MTDDVRIVPPGATATIDPLANDSATTGATIPPGSVRLLDGNGDPQTTLVVPGEGTWTVDTSTGQVSFVPEPGFAGPATPVTYRTTDTNGTDQTAQLRVTVSPPATATISNPPNGAIYYPYRDDVPATFSCTNAVSCTAVDGNGKPVANGQDLSAKNPGTYSITVTATDQYGNQVVTTHNYTVAKWVCAEDGLAVLRVPYSTYDFSDAPGSFLDLKHAPFTAASGTVHYAVEPLLATVVDPVTGLVGLPLTPYVHATNCIVAYAEDFVVDPITKPVVKSVKKLLKGLLG